MSNDLVSQQLSIPSNQMSHLEPISSKLDAPMSIGLMGFGTSDSLQQQIHLNMPTGQIGQMGSVSNDFGLHLSSMSNQQTQQIESRAYAQIPQQYIMPNKPVGEMMPNMLDAVKQHQLPILSKRKTPMEPLSPNSVPQKLAVPNKRVAEMEHRPWLQPISTSNKTAVQMLSSNSSGSMPSPASSKRSVPNKTGLSAPRNQPALMRTSSKLQTEPFESVRSKMRESLAGALALVSLQQGESSNAEKKSNGDAMSSPGKTQESPKSVDPNSGNTNASGSLSGDNNTAQTFKCGPLFQLGNLLPDEDVQFSDNIFARDELLQGNGLSWVLEPEIALAEKKEIDTIGKQNPDNEKMREDDLGKPVHSPEILASQIEAELFKLFVGVNKKYKEKGRSLLFNLKDRNNPELRERVVSGEISPGQLCSMSAEELASKELSEWRQAKAEELAQMVVLPDTEVDIRRLVRKTHKGEFQVEVEETDSTSVEVSGGALLSRRPKTVAKQAPTTDKTIGKKDESHTAGEKSNLEDPNLITIPSSEGPDPMQVLMGEDELKDAEFLPPIVSLDEFMQSLDSEPPFDNIPGDAGKAASPSDKADSVARSDSKSAGRVSQDPVDATSDKRGSVNSSNVKSEAEGKPNNAPAKEETTDSVVTLKREHVWEGSLQLNMTTMTPVIGNFKSGEKTSTNGWPSLLEIKGRVRLDAFEKFLQDLPMSRSRAVMVVHFVCKEGSSESERGSLVEAADFYVLDGRVGFAEPTSGVELYLCPPHAKTLGMFTNVLPKDQLEALNAIDNGLIGVVVWRRAQLISPNSHHKHTSKKQHFTSSTRRHQDKDSNMKTNYPSKPTHSHVPPLKPPPNEAGDDDDDDDVPPGFGPGSVKSREEDDLPEFNFSGGSNPSAEPRYPAGYQMTSSRLYSSQTSSSSSRAADQMRELIQKYGQPNSNTSIGVPMQPWNDDDDDIPEWQPQTSSQPQTQVHRYQQQPMNAALQLPHQPLQTMPVQGQQNVTQSLQQQGTWWVPPPGQQFVNELQYYGQPAWRKDAPNSRGF